MYGRRIHVGRKVMVLQSVKGTLKRGKGTFDFSTVLGEQVLEHKYHIDAIITFD